MLTCNNVILIGNWGAEPELRYTQSGKAVVNFDIAVHRPGTEAVDWFRVVCWEKLAEAVAQYCTKGQTVRGNFISLILAYIGNVFLKLICWPSI